MVQAPSPIRRTQVASRSSNHSGGLSSRRPGSRSGALACPESTATPRFGSSTDRAYHRTFATASCCNISRVGRGGRTTVTDRDERDQEAGERNDGGNLEGRGIVG